MIPQGMINRPSSLLLLALFIIAARAILLAGDLNQEELEQEQLARSVAAVFQSKCIACHSPARTEGSYDVSTFASMKRPGDSRKLPIAEKTSEESELLVRLTSNSEELRMPAESSPLSTEEIDLVRRWIEGGAKGFPNDDALLSEACAYDLVRFERLEHYPHAMPISAVAVSRDGSKVWSAGYGEVLQWEPNIPNPTKRIQGVGIHVAGLSIAHDDSLLAIGSGEPGKAGLIQTWNTVTGSLRVIDRTQDVVSGLNFAPESHRLAYGTSDGGVHIIDADKDSSLFRAIPHADAVLAINWSRDGNRILTASRDRTARSLEVSEQRWAAVYDRHERALEGVAFANNRPFTIDETGKLRFWNRDNGESIEADLNGFDRRLQKIVAWKDSVLLPSEGKIRRIEVEYREVDDGKDDKGNPKKRKKAFLIEKEALIASADHLLISIDVSDEGWVAAGSHRGSVFLWKIGAENETICKREFLANP